MRIIHMCTITMRYHIQQLLKATCTYRIGERSSKGLYCSPEEGVNSILITVLRFHFEEMLMYIFTCQHLFS